MDFTVDWFSRHIPVWQQLVLPRLPKDRPRRLLELGCWEGRSAAWLLENAMREGDELVCVDHWNTPAAESRFDANVGSRVTKIKSRTLPALVTMIQEAQQFDFVYIDADHSGRAILTDAVFAWQLLSPGGIIVFDDYAWPTPIEFSINAMPPASGIDAFLATHCLELRLLYKTYQVIVERFPPPHIVK